MNWISMQPLVGGLPLGAEQATGNKPSAILSYDAFRGNDSHYISRNPEVPMIEMSYETNDFLDEKSCELLDSLGEVDFVTAVPICSGLSMINRGGTSDPSSARGADAVQNENMYKCSIFALSRIKPKAFIAENAPGLYTSMGAAVVEKLRLIGSTYGYSMSVVKTNTKLHGIPQSRQRSFYFFWKSDTAPLLNWYTRERPTLEEYLKSVPKESKYNVEGLRGQTVLGQDTMYRWMKSKYGADYRQKLVESNQISILDYAKELDTFESLRKFAENENDSSLVKSIDRMREKLSRGLGYWVYGPKYYHETVNAVISKNYMEMIHPSEERYLTLRECMHLMGMPHDFDLGEKFNPNVICQNVPVTTAADWVHEVVKFCAGDHRDSGVSFVKQDNTARRIDVGPTVERGSISSFFS